MLLAALFCAACKKDPAPIGPGAGNIEGLTIGGQFPIIAWTGIDAADSGRKFGPMRDCGINVYLGWYETEEEVITALDNAEEAGVKLIIRSATFLTNPEKLIGKIKDHPALFMYHIQDEPSLSDFGWMKNIFNKAKELDPNHTCYINLFPNWAWGFEGASWTANAMSLLNNIPMKFISFDHYPIREIAGVSSIREEWYENLEDIRRVSRSRHIPFWGFALSLSHTMTNVEGVEEHYPIPTVAELRLQMFSNLVYGCQGFQYFTYWGIYQYRPTPVYDLVKTVNTELQTLSKVFLGADVQNVWHTGAVIPKGTKALRDMPEGVRSLTTSDGGAVVSSIEKDGKKYLALVNKDYKHNMTLNIEFASDVWKYDREGRKSQFSSGTLMVDAGDIVLFQL